MAKKFHIGKVIEAKAKEQRIGPTELGMMIGTSKQNVYAIFKRESIDTNQLKDISIALKSNLFQHYIDQLPVELKGQTGQLADLKKELADLKEKYSLLKQVNDLLQEKNKAKSK